VPSTRCTTYLVKLDAFFTPGVWCLVYRWPIDALGRVYNTKDIPIWSNALLVNWMLETKTSGTDLAWRRKPSSDIRWTIVQYMRILWSLRREDWKVVVGNKVRKETRTRFNFYRDYWLSFDVCHWLLPFCEGPSIIVHWKSVQKLSYIRKLSLYCYAIAYIVLNAHYRPWLGIKTRNRWAFSLLGLRLDASKLETRQSRCLWL